MEVDIETELEQRSQAAASLAGEHEAKAASAPRRSRMSKQATSQQRPADSGPLSPTKHADSVGAHAEGGKESDRGGLIGSKDSRLSKFESMQHYNSDA